MSPLLPDGSSSPERQPVTGRSPYTMTMHIASHRRAASARPSNRDEERKQTGRMRDTNTFVTAGRLSRHFRDGERKTRH